MAQDSNVKTSERGSGDISTVPIIEFVDNVDAFMALPENGENSQSVLKRMEELYSRVKIMEANNNNTKRRLKNQIEELEKSLNMLEELKKRKTNNEDMSTHFRLADHVFLKALIKPADTVGLWLGANVMVEYDLDEGEELLKSKQAKAQTSLQTTQEVMDSIREQITTIEVNMARVYNWDVKRRQMEKEQLSSKAPSNVAS